VIRAGLLTLAFEGLGLEGEDAAAASHAHSSFVFGAIFVAATRRLADEELVASEGAVPQDPRACEDSSCFTVGATNP